ncbi:capping protein inhibiting regulator of actin dynamics [Genypterus blacodes]|uniref:capping protein inhibiting regulator of actin dynamics n=1 Tax=Genypterus blacodes TaxID=154954 RepID=UPI003F776896
MSQENVSDKVRNLQRQIAQSIKFGQKPPSLRKSEGDEGSSDEEEVLQSPLKVMAQVEAEAEKTEPKAEAAQQAGPHSPPVKSPRSKRVLPPTGTIESINLDAVPQSAPRLDNTAAKHKLAVKPKNQRVSRKHRRLTQDFQEVSIPDVLLEDQEVAGVSTDGLCRTAAEEPHHEPLENLKKQRLHEEERLESRRKRELEEQRLRQEEEEHKKRAEELRQRELEQERYRRQQEEERNRKEEEERKRREEEERRVREEEERKRREEEVRMRREVEERRTREEQERRQREEEEKRRLEEQRRKEEEERKKREEEERERRQQELQAERQRVEKLREEEEERVKKEEAERQTLQEIEEKKKMEAEERKRKDDSAQRRLSQDETNGTSDPKERKRRAEELRWREMEERQRPFSFKVSSGEKQILFQKVNLTPVTPTSSHQGGAVADQRESSKVSSSEGPDSPNLPASPYVPHTAILVTGAQLCGTAVNLDQIKDTACKSLLGLGEDRKAQGTPAPKGKISPDRKSGKTKSLNESLLSTDQSGAAILAEWASIRSKIFKGVEEGKYDDYPEPSKTQNQNQPCAEDQAPFPHVNLRKTVSASAKFSITPAKKKFGDSNRNSEVLSQDDKEAGEEATPSETPTAASPAPSTKSQNRTSKSVRIVDRGSEECMFAKDLPSFLVPNPGTKTECAELRSRSQGDTEALRNQEEGGDRGQDGEGQPSPFGIKLRRTNFSLRFHSEQSTEKRKKRYSAGDSFDGVPSPLTPIEPDSDASSVFSDKSSPTSPQKEGVAGKYLHASASPAVPRAKPSKSTSAAAPSDSTPKPPLYQRPLTSPKPTGLVPTPPPSPLPKVVRGVTGEAVTQRIGVADSSGQGQTNRSEEPTSALEQLRRSSQGQVQGEEEPKEKRSFFPSINIPWREKADRKTELMKKEKPSLQSRHSVDGGRVQDKEAGPLWITLALQKQKGFREQQQNRDDRRSQREAKLAEKQAKDRDSVTLASPTDSKGNGSPSPSKPQTPEEPKRPDSLLGRFERREQLKKANTLPSSVTVEIADSTPSPPAVKEVSKRFPNSDSPQVSTEPAWLALAKRKAKAWSDCPQIIK